MGDKNMFWGIKFYINGDISIPIFIKVGKEFFSKFMKWVCECGTQDKSLGVKLKIKELYILLFQDYPQF